MPPIFPIESMEETGTNEKTAAKRGPGCGFGCLLAVLVAGLLASLAANGVLLLGLRIHEGTPSRKLAAHGPVDEIPQLTEVWSYGRGETVVARIPVAGLIMRSAGETLFGPGEDMVETIIRQIRVAQADQRVRALLLEINSPGGAVTPVDEIHQALLAFKASDPDRRVIAFCRDVAASGALFVTAAADLIIAEPTTLLGSISVIMRSLNWQPLSEKIGITDVTISSGKHKDLLNPFREVREEDVLIVQHVIDGLYDRFTQALRQGRGLTSEELAPYADGRVFLADVALEAGLIDHIGYWDDALEQTARMLEVDDVRLIRYRRDATFMDMLRNIRPGLAMRAWIAPSPGRFLYLWQPFSH